MAVVRQLVSPALLANCSRGVSALALNREALVCTATAGIRAQVTLRLVSTTPGNSRPDSASHFKRSAIKHPLAEQLSLTQEKSSYSLPHPIWSKEEVENVEITHHQPENKVDKAAFYTIQMLRTIFDLTSGYSLGKMFNTLDETKWLRRIIFLETVAAVPGMIAAMTRHLRSLRHMQRDYGWIHTLLEEAENERMHLLTAITLKNPSWLFRTAVIMAQAAYVSLFWVTYIVSPRFTHRLVGYLEEEAVKTYTHCLECIDNGSLKVWSQLKAPELARNYWKLPEGAMMRDVILAIRADEAHHRIVNHTFSSMQTDQLNPYRQGQ